MSRETVLPSTAAVFASAPMSATLGRLIEDNAKERKARAEALREAGRGNEVLLWPSSKISEGEESVSSIVTPPDEALERPKANSEERTAHLLLRVLGLCFIVPLAQPGPEGLPQSLSRHGIGVKEAIEALFSLMSEQAGTLEDIFTYPACGKPCTSQDVLTSTTIELWICPRLIAAASMLTLRSCAVVPATVVNDVSEVESAQQDADNLRTTILDLFKNFIRCALLKVNHLDSARTLLSELLRASSLALARTRNPFPKLSDSKTLKHQIDPDLGNSQTRQPEAVISFFERSVIQGHRITRPKPPHKAVNEGIARMWLPEDHSQFASPILQDGDPVLTHCLAHSCTLASVSVIIDLAMEFADIFTDLGQAASKLLLESWTRDLDAGSSKLTYRHLPLKLHNLRLQVVNRLLAKETFSEICPPNLLACIVVRSVLYYLDSKDQAAGNLAIEDHQLALLQHLAQSLRLLRVNVSTVPSGPWANLRCATSFFTDILATTTPLQGAVGSNGLLDVKDKAQADRLVCLKTCAAECVLLILHQSPTTSPFAPSVEADLQALLCGPDFDPMAWQENPSERAGDPKDETPNAWLSSDAVFEAKRQFSLLVKSRAAMGVGVSRKRKREEDHDSGHRLWIPFADLNAYRKVLEEDGDRIWQIETDARTASSAGEFINAGQEICVLGGTLRYQQYTAIRWCEICDVSDWEPEQLRESFVECPIELALKPLTGISQLDSTRQVGLLDLMRNRVMHSGDALFQEMAPLFEEVLGRILSHSDREVRLAAGRLAFAFVARQCELDVGTSEGETPSLRRRIGNVLAMHRRILDAARTGDLKVKETAIISLGHLGKLKWEEVREQALLLLVLELSGHVLLQSCAYLQITQLAAHHRCSTYALLSPHLGFISPPIVERMTSAPTLFLEVLNLTNQNQAKFLQATLSYTLPRVIANRNGKALSLMVDALGTTVPKLCLEQAPAILKQYLLLPPPQRDRNIATYLETIRQASNQDVPLRGLYRSYIGEILGHLVATLGDPERRILAIDGLRHIEATLSSDRNNRGRASKAMSANGGDLSAFLKEEILGILAWLNDDLMSVNGKKSPSFKAMVARSIGVFVEVVGSAISMVAPQIMATLSSTLQVPELRFATLQSWQTFMTTLRFDDVGPFIGQTAAALLSEWRSFTQAERKVAKSILSYVVVENAQEMRRYVAEIPNMEDLATELPEVCRKVRSSRQAWSAEQQLIQILDRVIDENTSISLRSLRELHTYMTENRFYVQQQTSGTAFAAIVGRMLGALLSTLRRSEEGQDELRDLCLECLARLGAVDPDRLEIPSEDSPHKLLNNFEDREETIDFAVHLIRDILVSAFRATSDTKHQAALAYAIQELLAFCGFTSSLLRPGCRAATVKVKQRWNELPPAVIDTVAPLLDSKYSITHGPVTDYPKPFYTHSSSYRDWIETWANHLMQGARGDDAVKIFGIFRVLIRHHDLDITQHILPHAVLHNLISGTDTQREDLRQEFISVLLDQVDPTTKFSSDRRLLCAQTVFALMDHMSAWLRSKRQEKSRQPRQRRDVAVLDEALVNVESVIASISQELMARASLTCRAYARSLLNFEQRIRGLRQAGKEDRNLQSYYEQLHMIYADIDEPDGMEGISTCIISPSLEHQIREHETTGRWTSAQSCWEVQIQADPREPSNHVGLLRCLRNLGHYDTMRTHVRGALSVNPQWEEMLAPFAIEGACILGDWDEVKAALARPGDGSPQHATARVLLAMTERADSSRFANVLSEAYRQLGKPILAAGRNSYAQVYESVLQLHTLHELELIYQQATSPRREPQRWHDLQQSLQARLESTLPSFRVREPLLSVRRTAFSTCRESGAHLEPIWRAEVADTWISTCKIARKAGHSQTAYSAVLQASVSGAPFAFVQRAKLLASNDQPHAAIQELNNALLSMQAAFSASLHGQPTENGIVDLTSEGSSPGFDRKAFANANLLRARLCEATGRFQSNEIIDKYRQSSKIDPHSEKMYYFLGRYYDSIRESTIANSMTQNHSVCRYFIKSAQLGTKFFYRTVPRLLTIWLDAGDEAFLVKVASKGGVKKSLNKENSLEDYDKAEAFEKIVMDIRRARDSLQPYQWLAVFPQLVSRIVHKNEAVWTVLKSILSLAVKHYPHQAMWGMVAAFQSTDANRRKRASDIVQTAKDSHTGKTIEMSQALASELLHLCNFPAAKPTTSFTIEQHFPRLQGLAGCGLILPLQSSVTVNLPPSYQPKADHRPFPLDLPLIQGFESTIEIMQSLQKPRKLSIIGSDGKHHAFLCKPKDDLRKDARLMEFDSMINKLLQANSDSRKRHLLVRTYAVVTLNEECGLIEWVPNTVGFRHILHKLYHARGIPLYSGEIRSLMDEARTNPRSSAKVFEEKVLIKYPPVFHEWFLNTFPEPSSWLKARLAYARTAAVMSMVGFVLGLGDRHGENILFDSMSGDTVHVDLNCLFEKGTTFEIPETVPFRLTQNMVDAMGVTGYEGVFRRAAEITMGILRTNKDSLTSVLEAMIHDPLVEWGAAEAASRGSGRSKGSSHVSVDPRVLAARQSLDPVAKKLDGCHRKDLPRGSVGGAWSPPLSTNNLVDALIREATSSKNLAAVYIGWSSYL